MTDVPTDFTDATIDAIIGNDEAGDVAGDLMNFANDATGSIQ